MTNALCRLVYRSDSLIDHGDSPALDAIFRVSVRNNSRDKITGALALPDGKFVQVIEGRRRDIDALMVRIQADERHTNVVVLGDWPIAARLFPGWAMARPDPTPLSDQAFRIVTEDGSGVQVTSILLSMSRGPAEVWL
ncbi:BLUF domain-containing protein [Brevundimonas sp.]|uniref:BLUF domain-containing protein n=1 Tax=Brevundimonas sp. TaxID=1871086 RepID=UPI00273033E7|nr:BLUF domain-containing protein [Brevundimonas sp.]MDP1913892.1 BLUF domain-containing protein [Brevundimonas sp.]